MCPDCKPACCSTSPRSLRHAIGKFVLLTFPATSVIFASRRALFDTTHKRYAYTGLNADSAKRRKTTGNPSRTLLVSYALPHSARHAGRPRHRVGLHCAAASSALNPRAQNAEEKRYAAPAISFRLVARAPSSMPQFRRSPDTFVRISCTAARFSPHPRPGFHGRPDIQ